MTAVGVHQLDSRVIASLNDRQSARCMGPHRSPSSYRKHDREERDRCNRQSQQRSESEHASSTRTDGGERRPFGQPILIRTEAALFS